METLQNKTIGQALAQMGAFDVETRERGCDYHPNYISTLIAGRWSECPKCVQEKIDYEMSEAGKKAAAERLAAQSQYLLKKAAIPPRFSDRSLENFIASNEGQQKALGTAQAYVNDFTKTSGQSLILCGGVGAGKTHIAVGIAHELIARQCQCIFTSVIGAVRSVKETYNRNSEITEREAIDNLIKPDLLILDEVGVQFGSDTEKLILFEIINGRYENRKSTIVISNLAMTALADYLGERVIDRLREDGGKLVVFDWPSFRRKAA